MNRVGPTWALVLTLDRDVLLAVVMANLGFAITSAALLFRARAALDRVLIGLGIFLLVCGGSLVGLHAFARTPVREAQVIVFD